MYLPVECCVCTRNAREEKEDVRAASDGRIWAKGFAKASKKFSKGVFLSIECMSLVDLRTAYL